LAEAHRLVVRDGQNPAALTKIRADLIECMRWYVPMDQVSDFEDYENVDDGYDHLFIRFASGMTLLVPL